MATIPMPIIVVLLIFATLSLFVLIVISVYIFKQHKHVNKLIDEIKERKITRKVQPGSYSKTHSLKDIGDDKF